VSELRRPNFVTQGFAVASFQLTFPKVKARGFFTALEGQIVVCTLTTENAKINLDHVDVTLDVPTKLQLGKAGVKIPTECSDCKVMPYPKTQTIAAQTLPEKPIEIDLANVGSTIDESSSKSLRYSK